MPVHPPSAGEWLLSKLLSREVAEVVLGDLEELYHERLGERPPTLRDRCWVAWQLLVLLVWCGARAPLGRILRGDAGGFRPIGSPARRRASFLDGLVRGAVDSVRRPWSVMAFAAVTAVATGPTAALFNLESWVQARASQTLVDVERLFTVTVQKDLGGGAVAPMGISVANLHDLARDAPGIAALGGRASLGLGFSIAGRPSVPVSGEVITEHYFELLGVSSTTGRLFNPEEMWPDADAAVAVMSFSLADRLGGEGFRTMVGRTVELNGVPFEVIGVVSPGFNGIDRLRPVGIWLPPAAYPRVRRLSSDESLGSAGDRRSSFFMEMVGRTASTADLEAIRDQLTMGMERLVRMYPSVNAAYGEQEIVVQRANAPDRIAQQGFSKHRPILWFGAVVLLLLGAAAAVSVICGSSRAQDIGPRPGRPEGDGATREAVGRRFGRVAVLGVSGVSLTVLCTWGLNRLVFSPDLLALSGSGLSGESGMVGLPGLEGKAVAFALGLASLFLGLALILERHGQWPRNWPEFPQRSPRRGIQTRPLEGLLIAAHAGLVAALLLMVLSLSRDPRNLHPETLGYDPRPLVVLDLRAEELASAPDEIPGQYDAIADAISALAEVTAVTWMSPGPFSGVLAHGWLRGGVDGARDEVRVSIRRVGGGAFQALGIEILEGQGFGAETAGKSMDEATIREIVIDLELATRLYGPGVAVGNTALLNGEPARIVGVASRAEFDVGSDRIGPVVYQAEGPLPSLASVLVQTPGEILPGRIADAVLAVHPRLTVTLRPLGDRAAERAGLARSVTRFLGLLAAVSLGLCMLGLWIHAHRRRRLSVPFPGRWPKDATSSEAIEGAILALAGLLSGLWVATWFSGWISRPEYPVEPMLPARYLALGTLVLTLTVTLAWASLRHRLGSR
jgi:putative ABC transport system permease protein